MSGFYISMTGLFLEFLVVVFFTQRYLFHFSHFSSV